MTNPKTTQEALLWRPVCKPQDGEPQGGWLARSVLIQNTSSGLVTIYEEKNQRYLSTSLWDETSSPGLQLTYSSPERFSVQTAIGGLALQRRLVVWEGVFLDALPALVEQLLAERNQAQKSRQWQKMGHLTGQLEALQKVS